VRATKHKRERQNITANNPGNRCERHGPGKRAGRGSRGGCPVGERAHLRGKPHEVMDRKHFSSHHNTAHLPGKFTPLQPKPADKGPVRTGRGSRVGSTIGKRAHRCLRGENRNPCEIDRPLLNTPNTPPPTGPDKDVIATAPSQSSRCSRCSSSSSSSSTKPYLARMEACCVYTWCHKHRHIMQKRDAGVRDASAGRMESGTTSNHVEAKASFPYEGCMPPGASLCLPVRHLRFLEKGSPTEPTRSLQDNIPLAQPTIYFMPSQHLTKKVAATAQLFAQKNPQVLGVPAHQQTLQRHRQRQQ